jgi:hypothetical protein
VQTWPIGETIRHQDGVVDPLVAALPFYDLVPKEPTAHLEWRCDVAERCLTDLEYRQGILDCCAKDFLFFVNFACWIIEPRDETGDSLLPFCTWSNQDPVMAALAFYAGRRRDIVGDKSRAQGASWMVVALFVWILLFRKRKILGFMSKDEPTADDPKDPSSLGWKIDFIIRNLPVWMRPPGIEVNGPNRSTTNHTWTNVLTDSTIKGYAANKTSGQGGRFTTFFLDEAAIFGANRDLTALSNLQQTCYNRIVISTPNGTEVEFHRLVKTPSIWLKIILDWEDNPSQNQGKYTSRDGKLVKLDEDYEFPPDYPFILDGIVRSPWFDNECARANHNMVEINRELRRDHGGSKSRPFPEEILAPMRQYIRPPDHTGRLSFERSDPSDIEAIEFVKTPSGPLSLWCRLDEEGLPPSGAYVVNCDPSSGVGGTSNFAAVQVFNGIGEQVAEFACNKTSPVRLAKLAVAMCYWFGRGSATPFLNWESNGGLGSQFFKEVERLMYPYVYMHKPTDQKGAKRTRRPGWHTTKTSNTLEPLANAITNGLIVIRSQDLLDECAAYEFGPTDWFHPAAASAKDPANQGVNHGDRACAAGVAVISLRDRHLLPEIRKRKKDEREPRLSEAPGNSMAGRHRERKRIAREQRSARSCVW